MKKRVLSIFLVLTMILSIMAVAIVSPVKASAAVEAGSLLEASQLEERRGLTSAEYATATNGTTSTNAGTTIIRWTNTDGGRMIGLYSSSGNFTGESVDIYWTRSKEYFYQEIERSVSKSGEKNYGNPFDFTLELIAKAGNSGGDSAAYQKDLTGALYSETTAAEYNGVTNGLAGILHTAEGPVGILPNLGGYPVYSLDDLLAEPKLTLTNADPRLLTTGSASTVIKDAFNKENRVFDTIMGGYEQIWDGGYGNYVGATAYRYRTTVEQVGKKPNEVLVTNASGEGVSWPEEPAPYNGITNFADSNFKVTLTADATVSGSRWTTPEILKTSTMNGTSGHLSTTKSVTITQPGTYIYYGAQWAVNSITTPTTVHNKTNAESNDLTIFYVVVGDNGEVTVYDGCYTWGTSTAGKSDTTHAKQTMTSSASGGVTTYTHTISNATGNTANGVAIGGVANAKQTSEAKYLDNIDTNYLEKLLVAVAAAEGYFNPSDFATVADEIAAVTNAIGSGKTAAEKLAAGRALIAAVGALTIDDTKLGILTTYGVDASNANTETIKLEVVYRVGDGDMKGSLKYYEYSYVYGDVSEIDLQVDSYNFVSSNTNVVRVDHAGKLIPVWSGTAEVYLEATIMNRKVTSIPVTVTVVGTTDTTDKILTGSDSVAGNKTMGIYCTGLYSPTKTTNTYGNNVPVTTLAGEGNNEGADLGLELIVTRKGDTSEQGEWCSWISHVWTNVGSNKDYGFQGVETIRRFTGFFEVGNDDYAQNSFFMADSSGRPILAGDDSFAIFINGSPLLRASTNVHGSGGATIDGLSSLSEAVRVLTSPESILTVGKNGGPWTPCPKAGCTITAENLGYASGWHTHIDGSEILNIKNFLIPGQVNRIDIIAGDHDDGGGMMKPIIYASPEPEPVVGKIGVKITAHLEQDEDEFKVNVSEKEVPSDEKVYYKYVVSNEHTTDLTEVSLIDRNTGIKITQDGAYFPDSVTGNYPSEPDVAFTDSNGYAAVKSAFTLLKVGAEIEIKIPANYLIYTEAGAYYNTVVATGYYEPSSGASKVATTATDRTFVTVSLGAPEDDWVVIDYGLPVKVKPLWNDTFVDETVTDMKVWAAVEEGEAPEPKDVKAAGTTEPIVQGKYGALYSLGEGMTYFNGKFTEETTLRYVPTSIVDEMDTFYYSYVDDGKTLGGKIEVVPATTVYYEDTFANSTNISDLKSGKIIWSGEWSIVNDGTNTTDTIDSVYQSDNNSTWGSDTDNYGLDGVYDGYGVYSFGSAHAIGKELDEKYQKEPTKLSVKELQDAYGSISHPTVYMTFQFKGTGFDVMMSTSNISGNFTCNVIKAEDYSGIKASGALNITTPVYKTTISNYYNNTGVTGQLNQLPVVSKHGLDCSTYIVQIGVSDARAYGSYGNVVVVDGIRIYNPLGTEGSEHYTDTEKDAMTYEIRDLIMAGSGSHTDKDGNIKNANKYENAIRLANSMYIDKNAYLDNGEDTTGKGIIDEKDMIEGQRWWYNPTELSNSGGGLSTGNPLNGAVLFKFFGPKNEVYLSSSNDVDARGAIVFMHQPGGNPGAQTVQVQAAKVGDKPVSMQVYLFDMNNNPLGVAKINLESASLQYFDVVSEMNLSTEQKETFQTATTVFVIVVDSVSGEENTESEDGAFGVASLGRIKLSDGAVLKSNDFAITPGDTKVLMTEEKPENPLTHNFGLISLGYGTLGNHQWTLSHTGVLPEGKNLSDYASISNPSTNALITVTINEILPDGVRLVLSVKADQTVDGGIVLQQDSIYIDTVAPVEGTTLGVADLTIMEYAAPLDLASKVTISHSSTDDEALKLAKEFGVSFALELEGGSALYPSFTGQTTTSNSDVLDPAALVAYGLSNKEDETEVKIKVTATSKYDPSVSEVFYVTVLKNTVNLIINPQELTLYVGDTVNLNECLGIILEYPWSPEAIELAEGVTWGFNASADPSLTIDAEGNVEALGLNAGGVVVAAKTKYDSATQQTVTIKIKNHEAELEFKNYPEVVYVDENTDGINLKNIIEYTIDEVKQSDKDIIEFTWESDTCSDVAIDEDGILTYGAPTTADGIGYITLNATGGYSSVAEEITIMVLYKLDFSINDLLPITEKEGKKSRLLTTDYLTFADDYDGFDDVEWTVTGGTITDAVVENGVLKYGTGFGTIILTATSTYAGALVEGYAGIKSVSVTITVTEKVDFIGGKAKSYAGSIDYLKGDVIFDNNYPTKFYIVKENITSGNGGIYGFINTQQAVVSLPDWKIYAGTEATYTEALEWKADKAYVIGNTVQYNGEIYVCSVAHTSSGTAPNTNWIKALFEGSSNEVRFKLIEPDVPEVFFDWNESKQSVFTGETYPNIKSWIGATVGGGADDGFTIALGNGSVTGAVLNGNKLDLSSVTTSGKVYITVTSAELDEDGINPLTVQTLELDVVKSSYSLNLAGASQNVYEGKEINISSWVNIVKNPADAPDLVLDTDYELKIVGNASNYSLSSDKKLTILAGAVVGNTITLQLVKKGSKDITDSAVVTLTITDAPAEVDAETPTIQTLADVTATQCTKVTLTVDANVLDGGTLSYQWYSNATKSNVGGTVISGATSASYIPSSTTVGTKYYYCVVTNTNNDATGTKTVLATSNAAEVIIEEIHFSFDDASFLDGPEVKAVGSQAAYSETGGLDGSGGLQLKGGAGSYLQITGDGFNYSQPFTITMWVKPDSVTSQQYLFTCNPGDDWFILRSNGYLGSYNMGGGNLTMTSANHAALQGNQWAHLVVTRSATQVTYYINGSQVYQHAATFSGSPAEFFSVGGKSNNDNSTGCFKGYMDEVSLLTRSLSASEVSALHTSQKPSSASPAAPDLSSLAIDFAGIAAGVYGSYVADSYDSPSIINDIVEDWKEFD